ncbi:hypothetical protein Q7P37_011190 [Cladosporium fusiforme]
MLSNVPTTSLKRHLIPLLRQKMSVRHSSTACLFCHPTSVIAARRRIHQSAKGSLQAVAVREDDDGGHAEECGEKDAESKDGLAGSLAHKMKEWTLQGRMDNFRDAALALEIMVKSRDMRIEAMKRLSNPWPSLYQQSHGHNSNHIPKSAVALRLPESQAAPIPHETFKELMRTTKGHKPLRSVIRAQMLRVQHPKELLRIVAVAMQTRANAEQLATFREPLIRALYRCRTTVTDREVLGTINTIVARLRFAGYTPADQLFSVGMKFAARARNVQGMKRYLKLVHEHKGAMTSNLFRSVIAKFSIGHRGLGEIRNGRWRRADLLQVLTGFDDCKHLPPDQQYHLGTFLEREDWQFLHGWIAVLARCKASDAVWDEWILWKQNEARVNPRKLEGQGIFVDTCVRGDYWFIEQMSYAGDIRRAWQILEDTAIPFSRLKTRVKSRLLEEVEHASIWTPQLTEAMLEKYDMDLSLIERAFGVKWEADAEGGSGQHVLFRDQEDALDELGADDWKCEEDFGFPVGDDEDAVRLSTQERSLHDAEPAKVATTH